MEDWQKGGFGLYVHWPFCVSKCPYCDFNSHVSASIDQNVWKDAYLSAIDLYSKETPNRTLSSIYFGGGTPSLMDATLVEAIINQAQKRWHFSNDIEITLEANPSSVEVGRLLDYKQAGVNRVSLGIQALNDTDLRRLGRMHSVSDALKALEIARTTFDRFSFDLIYARQNQSLASWQQELGKALDLKPDHLALYQLTVEAGTVFGARHLAGKLGGLPTEDLSADMYEITQETCNNNGLPAYEVSNHARINTHSRHNMIYWNAGDYIGIGPGAHGRLTIEGQRFATETALDPKVWLATVSPSNHGESIRESLPGIDQATEYLIMGLRTTTGVSLERFNSMAGSAINARKISELGKLGFLTSTNGFIVATPAGMPVLNGLLRELAPD